MTIQMEQNAGKVTLTLAGRLDTTTAPGLDATIQEELKDVQELILDMRELVYISSAGLRVLLSAQKKMQKQGSMKLKNVCSEVLEVFELTGFADILQIEAS